MDLDIQDMPVTRLCPAFSDFGKGNAKVLRDHPGVFVLFCFFFVFIVSVLPSNIPALMLREFCVSRRSLFHNPFLSLYGTVFFVFV